MYRTNIPSAAAVGALALVLSAGAQAQQNLPRIDIGAGQKPNVDAGARAAPRSSDARTASARPTAARAAPAPVLVAEPRRGSLTAPPVQDQRRETLSNVGSVAFVDGATPDIQTRYTHDLRDALKDVPGVFAQSRYGLEMRLSVRGSNLTRDYHLRGLELQQDGIPMNYFDGGGDMYEIDPKYFRSIEVLKGGNALAAGSSTLGGAVNFVSPTAHTALAPNIVSIEGGSFGTVRGQAQASRVFGDFDILLNGTFTHGDGYRQHAQSDYTHLNGNLGWRLNKNVESRLYFGFYETWQQLPGQLVSGDVYSRPWASTAPFLADPVNGFGANQARNVKNWRISNKTTIDTEFGRIDLTGWYIGNYLYHPIFVVIEQQGSTWGFAPKFTGHFDVAGHRNELVAGGRVWGGASSDNWYSNWNGMKLNPFGGIAPFPPFSFTGLSQFGIAATCGGFCGTLINPGFDPRIRNNRMSSLNLEAYFEDRFYVAPQLAFMFGAKLFSDERAYRVQGGIPFEPLANYSSKTYQGLNPKVGVMVQPTPDIQLFADLTGSRDVPDFIDLTQGYFPPFANVNGTFTPLNAQKAWTGEIGSRGKWDRFAWDVTFYHSELQDELLKFNTNPGAGVPATTFNAKRTMHQGVEFAGSVELLRDILGPQAGDALKLSQVWTWNDFRFVGDSSYGNNRIAGIPRHVLRTTLSYTQANGLYLAPQVDWVPQGAPVDYMNTLRAPGYALIGVQAGMKLPHGVSLYVEGRNLGNAHYVSDVSTIQDARGLAPAVFYPGDGRAVYGGMRVAF